MAEVEDIENFHPSNKIKGLNEQASSVKVDWKIPAKRYFRSSLEMTRMAKVYYSEDNLESAFVLYQKFLCLLLERLPKHPEYNLQEVSELKKTTKKLCKEAINTAEEVKVKLKAKFEEIYKQKQYEQSIRLQRLKEEAEQRALQEQRQREEAAARLADEQQANKMRAMEDEDRKFAMYLDQEMRKEANRNEPSAPVQPSAPSLPVSGTPPPPAYSNVPAIGVKVLPAAGLPINPPTYGEALAPTPTVQVPTVDRTNKPAHFTHTESDSSLTTNRFGLKKVSVPLSIPKRFTDLAQQNTAKGVETCGLLFAKLEHGTFHITHVVIPKQKGAPDSCTMLNEEEICDFHDKHELIQLGWIHTHPTQTAFLSSVDLHTHLNYQLMMPEAIAIVASPKYNEVGIFHLTPDHGLDYISKCASQGFHPHPKEPPLFTECEHVSMDSRVAEFVDLR